MLNKLGGVIIGSFAGIAFADKSFIFVVSILIFAYLFSTGYFFLEGVKDNENV